MLGWIQHVEETPEGLIFWETPERLHLEESIFRNIYLAEFQMKIVGKEHFELASNLETNYNQNIRSKNEKETSTFNK